MGGGGCYYEKILSGDWEIDCENLKSIVTSQSREKRELILLGEDEISHMPVDAALPVLHGKNGEDGTVQGLFELANIKIIGCDTRSSAICMDKERSHKLVSSYGIKVPKSMLINICNKEEIEKIVDVIKYPVFVKPVRGGSSIGISKVYDELNLKKSVEIAFENDDEVILEESIDGFEVGCAILGLDELIVGRVDEIELEGEFFDFEEKYTQLHSKIHMPARISKDKEIEIQDIAKRIYRILGCSGFARVDMFLNKEGEIVFNEVNTIPGCTEHSRYPNMLKGIGISFKQFLDILLNFYFES